MEVKRVKEILSARERIEVLYDNRPVWIEGIANDSSTVFLKVLGSDKCIQAKAEDLMETGIVI